jgi:penicillin-binding protein 1A
MLLGVTAAALALGAITAVGWVVHVATTGPNLDTRKPINLGATSSVYAADGTRLGFIQSAILRQPVGGAQIPQVMRDATVAIEDRRFFQHKGVDFEGILRAAVKNVSGGNIQGGSTLTMQLVRNLYTGERARSGIAGYKRKIREAKLAEELENRHPGHVGKEWILTQYLNSVPYGTVGGQTAVGVQAAARTFFDKPVKDLTLRQAALLAGLPQAPSAYNPFDEPQRAITRRNEVLQQMADQGFISQQVAQKTMKRGLGLNRNRYFTQRREGYFFDYVKQQLIDRYGVDTVRRGGLRVDTTIDLKLQQYARAAMNGTLGAPDRSAAIVTVDPNTGWIKAMASSSRYGQSKFNLAAQGHRQAGSTFKVMVLMTALEQGVNPDTTTYDSRPLAAGWLSTAPTYAVHTYSNTYGGPMNLVRATLTSDNSVYAQLDADVGPDNVAKTARMMGITSPLHGYPAEGLGGLTDGVSPLEMARAYATIASGGYRYDVTAIRKVTFPDGHVDDLGKPRKKKVFSDGVTYEATKILQQNVLSGTGYPNATQIGCPAAGKTGTVDNFSDAWFVGYTPQLVSAVWLGHADSRIPMPGVAGGTIPASIWGHYMRLARGSFCGGFPLPKEQFVSHPFFGKFATGSYSSPYSTGGSSTYGSPSTGTTTTTPTTPTTPSTGTTGGTGAGGTRYPPDQYQSPPQGPPPTGNGNGNNGNGNGNGVPGQ